MEETRMPDRSSNALVNPGFASNPPVKLNIPAKTLGLVLMILGIIGLVFSLIGLIGIFGICSGVVASVCGGTPLIWILGEVVALVGLAVGTFGAYQMFMLNHEGRNLLIYGLAIGVLGSIINAVGTFVFYAGYIDYAGSFAVGAVIGLIISLAVYFCLYYLIVISRFPDEPPLVPSAAVGPPPSYGPPPG
jgi:hypothetical protein